MWTELQMSSWLLWVKVFSFFYFFYPSCSRFTYILSLLLFLYRFSAQMMTTVGFGMETVTGAMSPYFSIMGAFIWALRAPAFNIHLLYLQNPAQDRQQVWAFTRLRPACLHVSLQLSNLERETEKFSSVSAWDIDMGRVTNGQMHRRQSRPSIKQFLVS